MTDLYAALQVPRDADRATIRRAYRKRAKATHPDTPDGDGKSFALVKLAHDTLTDDARRTRYDQTGEVGEAAVDNHRSGVMSMLSAGLDAALARLYDRAQPPIQSDMLRLTREAMRGLRQQWDGERNDLRKNIVISKELLGRWTANGENVMEAITRHRILYLEGNMRVISERIALMDEALELLDGAGFRFDYAPPMSPAEKWIAGGMQETNLLGMFGGAKRW